MIQCLPVWRILRPSCRSRCADVAVVRSKSPRIGPSSRRFPRAAAMGGFSNAIHSVPPSWQDGDAETSADGYHRGVKAMTPVMKWGHRMCATESIRRMNREYVVRLKKPLSEDRGRGKSLLPQKRMSAFQCSDGKTQLEYEEAGHDACEGKHEQRGGAQRLHDASAYDGAYAHAQIGP